MNLPYKLGEPLPEETWRGVRLETIFECCKWDVQSEDHCVLAEFPLLMDESEWTKLGSIAESLNRELCFAERELLDRRELQLQLRLPRELIKALRASAEPTPGIARVMRFDFHFTDRGWRISEVNADVPGGFIESSGFTRLMAAHYPGTTTPPDPADAYARIIASAVGPDAVIGLVHATAYSDDSQVMHFLEKKMRAYGLSTVMASPAHIEWEQNRAKISSSFAKIHLDAIVRFFPAEWLPMLRPKSEWAHFFKGGLTPMSNPGSAILVQSKRFPLVWNSLSTCLSTWRAVLPPTTCPSAVLNHLNDWVLKPALGRMGEDVAISGVTSEQKLARVHQAVRRHPFSWIAQERFSVLPLHYGSTSYYPTIGVFTIDGTVAGGYARVARKPLIDDEAQDIALLITASRGNA